MKNVVLKISLEVVNPVNDGYEDIEKFVNDAVLEKLMAEYDTKQFEGYKVLVELDESNEIPY